METRLINRLLVMIASFLTMQISCKGQEYTKKQLDSLYSNRYRLYDDVDAQDVKINGLYAISEDEKIMENLEVMFGKVDYYEKLGPFPDEGIEDIVYRYSYGCFSFNDCNGNDKINGIGFNNYPNEENKSLLYFGISFNKYKSKEFFLSLKEKKITIGNTLEDIRELFPDSYKYYHILSDNNYPVGFQVMIFPENKKIYFEFDENDIIKGIEIDEIE
ncbi:MAG: hypothetical protein ACX93O_02945 [Flagellimonas sp.]